MKSYLYLFILSLLLWAMWWRKKHPSTQHSITQITRNQWTKTFEENKYICLRIYYLCIEFWMLLEEYSNKFPRAFIIFIIESIRIFRYYCFQIGNQILKCLSLFLLLQINKLEPVKYFSKSFMHFTKLL